LRSEKGIVITLFFALNSNLTAVSENPLIVPSNPLKSPLTIFFR